jgi:two-component system, chemotaxis family, response regulator WspR
MRMSLLIVTEGEVASELLATARQLGLEPDGGGCGNALDQLEAGQVEVVVVDGRSALPVGLVELCRACAEREVPLLYLGAGAEDLMGTCASGSPGLFEAITVPVTLTLLRVRLEVMLELRRLRRELDRQALEIEVLQQELVELSSLDHDTGLFSHRYFIDHLAKEWRQAGRATTPLTLLCLSIDNFADYQRRYGKEEGMSCLCTVAQALYRCILRPNDLLARYGEAGFAILLPETEEEGAALVAQRLRLAVAELAIPHADAPLGVVSLSIGSVSPPLAYGKVCPTSAAILQIAELALARALAEGGDRIIVEDIPLMGKAGVLASC